MQNEPSTQTIGTETLSPVELDDGVIEFDLVALFAHIIKKAHWIALGALAGAIIAAVIVYFVISPVYAATSKLYIVSSDTSISLSDLQIGSNLAGDYQQVFNNWHVHELVSQRLGTDYSYKKFSKMVSVSTPSNTHILFITVRSGNPSEARLIANTYAEVASEFIAVKMDMRQPIIFEEAREPDESVFPNKTQAVIIGFVAGAIAVMIVISILFLFDDRILSSQDIAKVDGLTTLGIIPNLDTANGTNNKKAQSKAGRRSRKHEKSHDKRPS